MATQITALLDLATLEQMLSELLPLHVRLGDHGGPNRYFTVDAPTLVEFIEGRGLRVRTSAKAHWTLMGVPIPLTLKSIMFVLEPQIAPPPEPGKLIFKLKVEELDLKIMPGGIIEEAMLPLINEGLAILEGELGWDFAKTLNIKKEIPPSAAPLEAFTLAAGTAKIAVTKEAIILQLGLEMHFVQVGVKVVDTPIIGTPTNTTVAPAQ
jgi:hypothetical protein